MTEPANILADATIAAASVEKSRRIADDLRSAAARLREEADRLDELAAAQDRDAHKLSFASIRECAERLGIAYDAARKRVERSGAGRRFGQDILVNRDWLDGQIEMQRVRSTGQNPTRESPSSFTSDHQ